jgi:16S rRNA (cytidine1402-2'-O)-methyltransferase
VGYYTENAPRGEFVLIVNGAREEVTEYTLEDALKIADRLIGEGQSTSCAAKEAASITGLKKGDIYKRLLDR